MNPGVRMATSGRGRLGLALLLSVLSMPAPAAVDDILEAIRKSEFRFARTGGEVPFIPLGWLQYQYYPSTKFHDSDGLLAPAEASEHALSVGGIVPVYVDRRDMLLLGGDLAGDSVRVQSGPYRDQLLMRITPVAAWLHQFGSDHTLAAFAAPVFSKEFNEDHPWSTNGFAGVIGMYWYSDTLQWFYGVVTESYFGNNYLYPYFGVQWNPTPQWSVALLVPWPTISYAPVKDWLFQIGVAPGGVSWATRDTDYESTQAFRSWNTTFGAAYRFHGSWWLQVSAGLTGYRGVAQLVGGDGYRLDAEPSPVYALAIQFRP